ncbi:MAG TPA: 50S ribosomal protein L9 [Anaerohalosphaeraceae bacterium]|nr:50S ribosomal protein L9 [Phycisphaerae bacterium]HOK95373.1 50S ribosomal protein L9 [Anaerohalosphaeraceae bacterium]HOL31001.1 50S ribosomal protein L9 [Anaerohalosphaeraceae bacterium]HPO69091.1 50S ribosomal protein L9 [Anaerohalosphaeraceae bacterium]HRS70232.1 50S ribosomal protein L9 [Anaerohalosphaeraceae bacterium]
MKVLLVEDVEKLGWLGDVVEVKNGYARNYLLPQGLATIPTEANIKSLEAEKQRRAEIRRLERQQKEQLAARMEGAQVVIAAKANEMGHLFGSVTERDIADALRQQGFEVQDDMVKMPAGHIKEIGTHEVVLRIASDLRPAVRVVVVSEDQTVDADKKETNTQE